ncbi:di-heme oxidoredictase family protein [Shimia sp. FJ5]|uniref:di-heme oxidoreductase family protein n=2 Tax=Shimia TaxID=573139 RepID=UPI0039800DF8
MRRAAIAMGLWALCWASAGAAGPEALEPHLDALPRSAAEEARIAAVTESAAALNRFEHLSAGAASVAASGDKAFSHAMPTLEARQELDFLSGRALFKKIWVGAPSSTKASDGLGPLYNARSCLACHPGNGRGHVPEAGQIGGGHRGAALMLKLSGVPGYGGQLQTNSLSGLAAEARLDVQYETENVTLAGGEVVTLHHPVYAVSALGYGSWPEGAMTSPRLAPPLPGLGLIEAIRAEDILAGEDPEDADGDGISGRARRVMSREYGTEMIGRFGRKGAMATVREQSADAFSNDIGISSPLYPDPWGDCSAAQGECRDRPHGDEDVRVFEIDAKGLDLLTLYTAHLAVPERREADAPEVLRGKAVFHELGCAACHRPAYVTHRLKDDPSRSFQLIWPYSDFLLHDMGEGLADHRPEGMATGREWKTPPLWGLGQTGAVAGQERYLHDGRARSLLEAVLWHGGEAKAARERVVSLPPEERAALIRFLKSL